MSCKILGKPIHLTLLLLVGALFSLPAHATDLRGILSAIILPSKKAPRTIVEITVDNTSTVGGGPMDSPGTTAKLFPSYRATLEQLIDPNKVVVSHSCGRDGTTDEDYCVFNLETVHAHTKAVFRAEFSIANVCPDYFPLFSVFVTGFLHDPNLGNNTDKELLVCSDKESKGTKGLNAMLKILLE